MATSQLVEALDETGFGLRATFVWHRDRYAHTIAVVNESSAFPFIASHEGGDDEDWPSSPPLQQLSIEAREQSHVALLLGMAGKSHWSLSVATQPAQRAIVFDVACRANQRPDRLASSYRMMQAAQSCDDTVAIWRIGDYACRLVVISVDRHQAAVVDLSDNEIAVSNRLDAASIPTTLRWSYRLELQR